ncbi:MAG: uroporphyrinogen-III C-methyltransferase [Pseudomonadota bacterium]
MNDQHKDDQASEETESTDEKSTDQKQPKPPQNAENVESQNSLASDTASADQAEADSEKSISNQGKHGPIPALVKTDKGWAVLALLIALLAIALASYPYWSWRIAGLPAPNDHSDTLTELRQELDQLQRQRALMQAELERQIEGQDHSIRQLGNQLEEIQQTIASQSLLDDQFDARIAAQIESLLQTELQSQSELQQASQATIQAQLDERLTTMLTDLDSRIELLQNQQAEVESNHSNRMQVFEDRNREQFEQMTTRLESVGQELDDTSQNASERLLLVQLEALLAMGQDRLELAGDAAGARMALERALQRLQTQDIAEFAALEQSIRREQGLIEKYLEDDSGLSVERRFIRLNELAEQVPEWPAHDQIASSSTQSDAASDAAAEGWGARVGQALSGLVRIENVDQAGPSAPEIEQTRIRIQHALRAAALAGARQDWDLNQALIEVVRHDMQTVLNTRSSAVMQAMEELDTLKARPDRSGIPALGEARERVISLLERS